MGRPRQRTLHPAWRYRPSREGLALPIVGLFLLFLVPGCAQQAQTAAPAKVDQTTEPISKSVVKKKKPEDAHPTSVAKESHQQAPSAGMSKQPEPASKQPEQDKALAEKDQLKKETSARVASDKKSRKSPKSQAEAQPPTDDVFLSPIPLPSKPAAIGGSGG